MEKKKYVNVKVPQPIWSKLDEIVKLTGFKKKYVIESILAWAGENPHEALRITLARINKILEKGKNYGPTDQRPKDTNS